jgi:hypothetical protein
MNAASSMTGNTSTASNSHFATFIGISLNCSRLALASRSSKVRR